MGTGRMWAVAGWMAASLMCKPTMVTLPCLLLLLDAWPLERWKRETAWGLVREKWMLWVLVAASCRMTLAVQESAMSSLENIGFGDRVATAMRAYGWYLEKWLWPTGLAFFYPWEWAGVTWTGAAVCGAVLAAASAGVVWAWRKKGVGGVGVGWFWYLGTLVPMIGLVQVGRQVWADRYSYWPEMGLWLAAACLAAEALGKRPPFWRRAAAVAGLLAAVALGWMARGQTAAWRDGTELVTRGEGVTGKHVTGERVLGEEAYRKGDWAEAAAHWKLATEMDGQFGDAWSQLGMARYASGNHAAAREAWEMAVQVDGRQWMAMNNLAWVCLEDGEIEIARMWIEKALEFPAARASEGVWDTERAVRDAEEGTKVTKGPTGTGQGGGMRE